MLGFGILKGMSVTLRRFVDTYVGDLRHFPRRHSSGAVYKRMGITDRGAFTIQYPEEKVPMFPRYRGPLMLLTDPEKGITKCIACGLCERTCPTESLKVTRAEEKVDGQRVPESYEYDMNTCMFCGFCVQICPSDALGHSPELETSTYEKGATLMLDLEQMLELGRKHAPDGVWPVEMEAEPS
jgi:NADH-quinone oxidoreductase subunit I